MSKRADSRSKDDKKRQHNAQTINIINNNININYIAYTPPQDDDTPYPHQHSLAETALAIVSFFSNMPGFVVFLQLAFQFLQGL